MIFEIAVDKYGVMKITSLHRHIVNNINSIDRDNININISEYANYSVIINNVVNRSISENRVNINNFLNNEDVDIIDLNYEKEWDVLFKNQTISGDYSKKVILGIMPRVSIRQGLLLRRYKRKLSIRDASKANISEKEDYNFFSDKFLLKQKPYNLEDLIFHLGMYSLPNASFIIENENTKGSITNGNFILSFDDRKYTLFKNDYMDNINIDENSFIWFYNIFKEVRYYGMFRSNIVKVMTQMSNINFGAINEKKDIIYNSSNNHI
ncbi:hypothetical protein H8356DRAFT_1332627 [Neocallimastix lanati (nom. inval.)]|nr:hypothetical protein H8356DRAFT_1332627 [Neocallimastix sp. JGI-2020a]